MSTIKLNDLITEGNTLNESTGDRLYAYTEQGTGDILALYYALGSGSDIKLRNKKSFNSKEHSHDVKKLYKWAKSQKPIKKTDKYEVYKVPHYGYITSYIETKPGEYIHSKLSVWGGKHKPKKYLYLTFSTDSSQKYQVIDIFDDKNEALNWISK